MHGEVDLAGVHEGPEVKAVLGFRGHPVGVEPYEQVDGFHEGLIGQLRQRQPPGGAPEPAGVGFGAEDRDPPILLPVRLEPLENRLRVMEDGRSRIHRDRSIWTDLGVMPPAAARPARYRHVLAENPPEAGIGEDALALGRRRPPGCRRDVERETDRGGAHWYPV